MQPVLAHPFALVHREVGTMRTCKIPRQATSGMWSFLNPIHCASTVLCLTSTGIAEPLQHADRFELRAVHFRVDEKPPANPKDSPVGVQAMIG